MILEAKSFFERHKSDNLLALLFERVVSWDPNY
jgi:hypothetical protein